MDGLLRWLVSADLDTPEGHCLSWWNPDRPGYPYPEISGLLLRLLAGYRLAPARQARLRTALLREVAVAGGVRRGDRYYTFDAAMALHGLVSSGPGDDRQAWCAGVRRLTDLVVDGACRGDPAAGGRPGEPLCPDTPWSLSFGAHQAKACAALLAAAPVTGSTSGTGAAVERLVAAARDVQCDDGRFRVHRLARVTYAHSHCYALEGLLAAGAAGAATVAGADWLVSAQQPAGGLLAWHDGTSASGPVRADATAQALRIWLLVDPDRYAEPAARAVAALHALRVPGRGLRYEPGSADVNSWATIFAVQALSWHAAPGRADATGLV